MKSAILLVLCISLLSVPGAVRADIVDSDNPSNFNGTPIAAGSWIWFNANFKYQSGPTGFDVLIETDASYIAFSADGVDYTIPVPNAAITLSPFAVAPALDFREVTQTWRNILPFFGDDIFMTGVAWQVPVDLPGGINPVNFHVRFRSDAPSVALSWKWGAAVYTDFTDVYDDLGIQAIHDGAHAGTPSDVWQDLVVGGARGGGGSNFTGSWSSTQSVVLNNPVAVEQTSWSRVKALFE